MWTPRTIPELQQWVLQKIKDQRPDLSDLEAELTAEITCATIESPEYIPRFLEGFQEIFMDKWPMNKEGVA